MESEFRSFLHGRTERQTPPVTTQEYPQTCTKSCPHVQCSSWGTSEMKDKPCRNRTKTNEELQSFTQILDPNRTLTNEEIQQRFKRNLEKALKPLADTYKRLEAIENKIRNQPNYHVLAYPQDLQPFNGEGVRLFNRVDSGRNQSRIITETPKND